MTPTDPERRNQLDASVRVRFFGGPLDGDATATEEPPDLLIVDRGWYERQDQGDLPTMRWVPNDR